MVENVVFKKGWVTLSTNFMGYGSSPMNNCWRQKTKFPGLSRGTVCVILGLAILVVHRLVSHGQTDGRTDRHTMTASTTLA